MLLKYGQIKPEREKDSLTGAKHISQMGYFSSFLVFMGQGAHFLEDVQEKVKFSVCVCLAEWFLLRLMNDLRRKKNYYKRSKETLTVSRRSQTQWGDILVHSKTRSDERASPSTRNSSLDSPKSRRF